MKVGVLAFFRAKDFHGAYYACRKKSRPIIYNKEISAREAEPEQHNIFKGSTCIVGREERKLERM